MDTVIQIFLIAISTLTENADYLKKTVNKSKPLEQTTKTMIFRMLFTLGLLSKHFDIESPEFTEYKVLVFFVVSKLCRFKAKYHL